MYEGGSVVAQLGLHLVNILGLRDLPVVVEEVEMVILCHVCAEDNTAYGQFLVLRVYFRKNPLVASWSRFYLEK